MKNLVMIIKRRIKKRRKGGEQKPLWDEIKEMQY